VVFRTESVFVDHPGLVEVVEFIDLSGELLAFHFEHIKKIGLRMDRGVRPFQVCADFIR